MKQLKDVIHYYINTGAKIKWLREDDEWIESELTISDYPFHRTKFHQIILRDLSALTKEIEHNGEKFVPIVKLFEMIEPMWYQSYLGEVSDPSLQIDDGWNHCLSYGSVMESELCFSYDDKGSFTLMVDQDVEIFPNQLELFEKLFEWHFDVFDLHSQNQCIYK